MISVVKLGGSLSTDTILKLWVEMLVEYGGGKVVIVPGGGPYADEVRAAQRRWNFDDTIAHRMALLAMDQYGLQLKGIAPTLVTVDSVQTIDSTMREKKVAIWLPSVMVLAAPDVSATWDTTSDSLGVWLAKTIHAARLILVKSCNVKTEDSIAVLARQGIVDASFEMMTSGTQLKIDVISKNNLEYVRERLIAG